MTISKDKAGVCFEMDWKRGQKQELCVYSKPAPSTKFTNPYKKINGLAGISVRWVTEEAVAKNEGRRDITGGSHIKVVPASSLDIGKVLTADILAKHT